MNVIMTKHMYGWYFYTGVLVMNVILTTKLSVEHPGTALRPHKSSKWANITFVLSSAQKWSPAVSSTDKNLWAEMPLSCCASAKLHTSKFEQEEMSGNKHTRNKLRWRNSMQKEHIWLWHIDKGWLKNSYVLQSIFNDVHTEKSFFFFKWLKEQDV